MRLLISILWILLLASCQQSTKETTNSTQPLNQKKLIAELDSMEVLDQKYRSKLQSTPLSSPESGNLWSQQQVIDQSNLKRLEEIIAEFGFPGRSLVGEDGSRTAFLILQHSPDSIMEKYYDMVIKAGESGNLDMSRVAMFQDRVLMRRGEKQIYGTQVRSEQRYDKVKQEYYDSAYVWPIENPEEVNKRRLEVGLNEPIESYVRKFGIEYKN